MSDTLPSPTVAPAGLDQLDPLLGHRTRLGAMVLLCRNLELSFVRLRAVLGETDGNLGAQLRKLEEAKYVTVRKEFVQRKPVSWYALTPTGRRRLKAHLQALGAVVRAADI